MTLSVMKKYVYMTLGTQRNEEEEVGKEVEVLEAQLNVIHAVFLAIQSSTSLGEDIFLKGQKIFQTLLESHFTETLEVHMWDDLVTCLFNTHCRKTYTSEHFFPLTSSGDILSFYRTPAERTLSPSWRSDVSSDFRDKP